MKNGIMQSINYAYDLSKDNGNPMNRAEMFEHIKFAHKNESDDLINKCLDDVYK